MFGVGICHPRMATTTVSGAVQLRWQGNPIASPNGDRVRSPGGRLTYYGGVELGDGSSMTPAVVAVNDIVEVAPKRTSRSTGKLDVPFLAQVSGHM